jgi:rfaE bifunctional protein kinase chain/domain
MKPILSRTRLGAILDKFRSVKIGVVGDFALDGYWHADMTRAQISRETPLFNRPVVAEKYSPGGAANVTWNLADLGLGEVFAISVFGEDWRGAILRSIFDRLKVNLDGIVTQADWRTPFYGKVVLHGLQSQQEDARLDIMNDQPLSNETEQRLVNHLSAQMCRMDALIVCDMIPGGVVTPVVIQSLVSMTTNHPQVLFTADSRENLARFDHMVLKPNEIEASQLLFPLDDPSIHSLESLSNDLTRQFGSEIRPTYLTAGEKGCYLCTLPVPVLIPALKVSPPLDTVGAGDTFGAMLTAALAAGASPVEAGFMANLASAVTIRKLGVTGTASPAELLVAYDSYFPEK